MNGSHPNRTSQTTDERTLKFLAADKDIASGADAVRDEIIITSATSSGRKTAKRRTETKSVGLGDAITLARSKANKSAAGTSAADVLAQVQRNVMETTPTAASATVKEEPTATAATAEESGTINSLDMPALSNEQKAARKSFLGSAWSGIVDGLGTVHRTVSDRMTKMTEEHDGRLARIRGAAKWKYDSIRKSNLARKSAEVLKRAVVDAPAIIVTYVGSFAVHIVADLVMIIGTGVNETIKVTGNGVAMLFAYGWGASAEARYSFDELLIKIKERFSQAGVKYQESSTEGGVVLSAASA